VKKLVIIIFILPVFSFAQQRVPNFPIDSLSGHIQYRLNLDFPGDDKKKIFDVMIKWFSSNGGPDNPAIIRQDRDGNGIHAVLLGSYDPHYEGLVNNVSSIRFQLDMTVINGQAVITISDLELDRDGSLVPLEVFRGDVARTNTNEQAAKFPLQGMTAAQVKNLTEKFADKDSDLLDNINQMASGILRDARKYAKKAQKKQLL
jgi:hypothetical protein